MEKFYSSTLGCMVQQVQKRTARNMFHEGEVIYLCPCNMRFDNVWQKPFEISNVSGAWYGYTFDQLCNNYEHYNCDSERGRYVRFYVKCK